MMLKIVRILVIIALGSANVCKAQTIKTTRDIGLWAGFSAEKKLNKKWNINTKQQIRLAENLTKLNEIISEYGVDYKINKKFKLAAGTRYEHDRNADYKFRSDIRYHLDFMFKHKLNNRLGLKYRFRYQKEFSNLFVARNTFKENAKTRNRITATYLHKKHSYFMDAEIFREQTLYRKPYYNKARFRIGDKLAINKGEIKYALAYERELNNAYPLNFVFLILNYNFKL